MGAATQAKTKDQRRYLRRLVTAAVLLCLMAAAISCGPSDEELQNKIRAALDNDTRLQVTVKNRELTLAGTVPDNASSQRAYQAAAAIPGVKKINKLVKVVPPPRVYTIPAGTTLRVVMLDAVDSSVNRAGQTFTAALQFAVTSGDTVVIPEGAKVEVLLAQVQQAGRLKGASQLELALKSIDCFGTIYELKSSKVTEAGESRSAQSTKRIGIATGAGALVGALVGKGKGALIGAGVGAAGSTAYQLATRGPTVRVPAQTKLDFTLREPVAFTLPPKSP